MGAPNPLYIDIEDGTGQLEVSRYQWPDGFTAPSYGSFIEALTEVFREDHDYKTLVIDGFDRLENLIWEMLCEQSHQQKGKKCASIADAFKGFGEGYAAAAREMRLLCHKLDKIRIKKEMHIVILAHSTIHKFKNPDGADFDRFQLRLHDKAGSVLKEWTDVLGYMSFEDGVTSSDHKPKAYSTGRRLIHFERSAAFDAKTRLKLPDLVHVEGPQTWQTWQNLIDV